MFNFTDRDGNKVPFLKVVVPAWIAFIVNMGLIGHIIYLSGQRPSAPDPAQGFVVAQNVNREIVYLSQTDVAVHIGLWCLAFAYMGGIMIYYWRLGIFHRWQARP